MMKNRFIFICAFICLIFFLINLFSFESYIFITSNNYSIENIVFTDNITGYPFLIVPNIVHYILFTIHKIEFGHFISILSALRNQKPDKIMTHCDYDEVSGDNQLRILKISQKTRTKIIFNKIEKPTEIYGKPLNKDWLDWHVQLDIML